MLQQPVRGSRPISTLPSLDRMTVGQAFAPRVEYVIGRDGLSGGCSLTAYLVGEDRRAKPQVLFEHRWQNAPQSIEECLLVAYRGLHAYFEEDGISPS